MGNSPSVVTRGNSDESDEWSWETGASWNSCSLLSETGGTSTTGNTWSWPWQTRGTDTTTNVWSWLGETRGTDTTATSTSLETRDAIKTLCSLFLEIIGTDTTRNSVSSPLETRGRDTTRNSRPRLWETSETDTETSDTDTGAFSAPSLFETRRAETTRNSRPWQRETSDTGSLRTESRKEKWLTDRPWRQTFFSLEFEHKVSENIKKIQLEGRLNLLVMGPVGSGKSSFINAVCSIADGIILSRAHSGSSASSYTVAYKGYTQNTLLKHFILRDTMGIEPNDGAGFNIKDFKYLIKGHIKNNYTFNPAEPITSSDDYFREIPETTTAIHCVIFVISAVDVYHYIPEKSIRKIKQLQDDLRMEQIPSILVLTKADQLCEKVKEDVGNMFRSIKVLMAVEKASEIFDIDQASVHPVVNYEESRTLTPEQNIPLLLALGQSMVYAVVRVKQSQDDD